MQRSMTKGFQIAFILLSLLSGTVVETRTTAWGAAQNSITVTSPVTDSTWDGGTTQTISWTDATKPLYSYAGATISLSYDGGTNWEDIVTNVTTTDASDTTHTYQLTLPARFSRNTKVKVVGTFRRSATDTETQEDSADATILLRLGGEVNTASSSNVSYTLPTGQGTIEVSGDVYVNSGATLSFPSSITLAAVSGTPTYDSTEGEISGKIELIVAGTLDIQSGETRTLRSASQSGQSDWGGILFKANSAGAVQNVSITNAQVGIKVTGRVTPTITNNTITNCLTGIYLDTSDPSITNCTITGNGRGITIENASPTITGCTISSQTGDYGIYVTGATSLPKLGNYSTIGAGNNNFSANPNNLNLYTVAPLPFFAEGNNWGTSTAGSYTRDNSVIDSTIFDNEDSGASGGEVYFAPKVTSFSVSDQSSGSTTTTSSRNVNFSVSMLRETTGSPSAYQISENANFSDASWLTYASSGTFTLSSGDGAKTIYFKTRDNQKNESNTKSQSITLDSSSPSITNLTADGKGSNTTISSLPLVQATIADGGSVDTSNMSITFSGQTPITSGISYNSSTGALSYQVTSSLPTGTYRLTLSVSDTSGNTTTATLEDLTVVTSSAVSGSPEIAEGTTPLPYPSPFRPSQGSVNFTYTLTAAGDIQLYLFDMSGRVVWKRAFVSGTTGAQGGFNQVSWNGVSDLGGTIPNGVYFLKITHAGKVIGSTKLAVLE